MYELQEEVDSAASDQTDSPDAETHNVNANRMSLAELDDSPQNDNSETPP